MTRETVSIELDIPETLLSDYELETRMVVAILLPSVIEVMTDHVGKWRRMHEARA
jgi:hypothetical protein